MGRMIAPHAPRAAFAAAALFLGEMAVAEDTGRVYIGDGMTAGGQEMMRWADSPIQLSTHNAMYETHLKSNYLTGAPYKDNIGSDRNDTGYAATNLPFDERTWNVGNAARTIRDGNDFEVVAIGYSALDVGHNFAHPDWGSSYIPETFYMMVSDISGGAQTYGIPRMIFGVDIGAGAMFQAPHESEPSPHPFAQERGNEQVFRVFEHDPQEGLTLIAARGRNGALGKIYLDDSNIYLGSYKDNFAAGGSPQRIFFKLANTQAVVGESGEQNEWGVFTNIDDGGSNVLNTGKWAWRQSIGHGATRNGAYWAGRAPGDAGWTRMMELNSTGLLGVRAIGFNTAGDQKVGGFTELASGQVTITARCNANSIVLATRRDKAGTAFGTLRAKPGAGTITIYSERANGDVETSDNSYVNWLVFETVTL